MTVIFLTAAMEAKPFKTNETTKLFGSLGVFFYICWLPLFWEDNISLTKKFRKYYDKVRYVVVVIFILFTFSSIGALFTQNNLTARQLYDRSHLATITPFVKLFYATLSYNKKKIGNIFYYLAVVLRELYNDLELEEQMTRKVKMTAVIFFIGTMLGVAGTNGFIAILNVIVRGKLDRHTFFGSCLLAIIFIFCFGHILNCRRNVLPCGAGVARRR